MSQKSAFFFVFFLMVPITAFSLGFGKLTTYSKLNEPLKVHIDIIDSKSIYLEDIIIKNANLSTYQQAGIPRPSLFNKVQFKTKKQSNGSIIVELSTKKPLREPFITFIIDMKWRTGHINREYTFLLDPPEFIHKNSFPKNSAKISKQRTTASKTTTRATRKKPAARQRNIDYSAVVAAHIDGETYRATRRADTLWDIAKKVKPDNSVTTHQTMQALFALNPDAFIKGNINLLKQGQRLKLPNSNEIRQINGLPALKKPASPAIKRTSVSASTSTQIDSKQATEASPAKKTASKTAEQQYTDNAQLKILSPAEDLLKAPVTSTEDLLLINKALQSSINTIKSLQNENQELSEQLSSLTDKLNNLDKHNEELNNRISEISLSLNSNKTNNTETAQGNGLSDNISSDLSLKVDSGSVPAVKQHSFIRELLTSPVIIFALALFIVIILGSILFTMRSQKSKTEKKIHDTHSDLNQVSDSIYKTQEIQRPKPKSPVNQISEGNFSESLQGTDISEEKDEDDMDFFEYFEKKINAPDEQTDSAVSTQAESEDSADISFDIDLSEEIVDEYKNNSSLSGSNSRSSILSEIDTYMAYGNYNEAEKLLITELKISPVNKNLHLKLFECYTFSNKRYEFINHAEKIVSLLNTDIVLRHRIENIFQQTWNESLTPGSNS